MPPTPVAFFAYNRPDHADRALEALERCAGREAFEFHFFADGAKSEAHRPAVEATRARLRAWAPRFGARLHEQAANRGLAGSIATGVTDLCASHGRAVVLEDDLVVSPDFLRFMGAALDRYEHEPRVMQVAGCTLRPPGPLATDAFLLPITTTWGWGTWARAWRAFEAQPADPARLAADAPWRARFTVNGACDYEAMLQARLAGRNDSWGILWWYAVSREAGLVAYPAESLVWNGGFDGSGVHCDTSDLFAEAGRLEVLARRLPAAIRFPEAVAVEPAHVAALEAYFRSLSAAAPAAPALRSRLGRLLQSVQHALR